MTSRRAGAPPDRTAALRYALPGPGGTVWLGLAPLPLAGLLATAVTAVLLMLTGASPVLVAPVALLGAAGAAMPVAGRSPLQWSPTALRHLTGTLTGSRDHIAQRLTGRRSPALGVGPAACGCWTAASPTGARAPPMPAAPPPVRCPAGPAWGC